MIEEAEVNTMLNSLWNVLIHHTEVQDAHVTAHESLGMVCLFTKPEKNCYKLGKFVEKSQYPFNNCYHKQVLWIWKKKIIEINLHIS